MIYLLHSNKPLGGTGQHSARHYLGWAKEETWRRRVKEHLAGTTNVSIIQAYHRIGAKLVLVAILPGGTRTDERELKVMGRFKRLCPICNNKLLVGGQPEVVALIPRRRASSVPSIRRVMNSGGASLPRNLTLPLTLDGTAPQPLSPDSSTSSIVAGAAPENGGKCSTATVPGHVR